MSLAEWHSMHGGREWRVTPDGILSRGPGGDVERHRTRGAPTTMRLYLAGWRDELVGAALAEKVPLALLMMTVATENGPARIDGTEVQYIQVRREPGYVSDQETPHKISVGPCHVLISSARAALGEPGIHRGWLLDPANNIRAAARFMANQRGRTGFDPILVAAAYNAGGLYEAVPGRSRWGNRWHLQTYGSHLDRAAAWYGDACAVILEDRNLWSIDLGGLGRVGVAA